MMKKITIRPAKKYEIFADGESLGEFTKTSEWNGMAQFEKKDAMLILDLPSDFTTFINRIMGDDDTEMEATVMKLSPSLAEKVKLHDADAARAREMDKMIDIHFARGHRAQ